MAEYLSPGVYVEEIPSGIKPIEAVGTSTGAFVGIAEQGSVGKAELVTNFSQFMQKFGGFIPNGFLAYGVQHFFAEGGTRCYVVRAYNKPLNGEDGIAHTTILGLSPMDTVLEVKALNPGAWGNRISIDIEEDPDPDDIANTKERFKLIVNYQEKGEAKSKVVETYENLTMPALTSDGLPNLNYVVFQINEISKYISVKVPEGLADADRHMPLTTIDGDIRLMAEYALTNGSDGEVLSADDLASGLDAFDKVDDINIVATPDIVATHNQIVATDLQRRDAIIKAFTYCENRMDCFYIADCVKNLTPQEVLAFKQGLSANGKDFTGNAFNSKYGALYYPWIEVTDPLTARRMLFPPSCAMAGTYSATDVRRGVHKAPAGTIDGYLNVAANIERIVTKGEQDTLNNKGINVIRKFPEAGIVVWGARTVSSDPEWKYINVRRLFLMIEESIDEGTQWVVFEPNDARLWDRIVTNVTAFLRTVWASGALVGAKPEQAFFVKCDSETNPPESVDLGRVITEIGVAPVKPAEFVIFRIMQSKGGSSVSE